MLKSDFRYIIKKIIIGIGIILGISFIRSCNVYALESSQYSTYFYDQVIINNPSTIYHSNNNVGDKYTFVIDNYEYNIEYKSNGLYINDILVQSNLTYALQNKWVIGKFSSSNNVTFYACYPTSGNVVSNNVFITGSILNYPNNFPLSVNHLSCNSNSYNRIRVNFSNGEYISQNSSTVYNATVNGTNFSGTFLNGYDYFVFGTNANFELYFSNSNQQWITSDFTNPNYNLINSTINSLNPTPILSNDNSILLGYNFKLNFTNFDTRYFVYKYRVGDSRTLILNSNNYELSVRNNDTLYVWVEDLEGNVIDSETFTVSNIGNSYNGEYSIDFTYKDLAPSDTDNSTGLSHIIDRVDIDITYLPKTNILKYQYQYVISGSSLDSQNWIQLNNNNSLNNYTYVAHDNGTLYARILDQNDIVVANNTFTVDSIGKLKLFDSDYNIGGIFGAFTNNINYSGPIYSLILIPINFINTIYSHSSSTCQRYKLGTLFNNDIYFDCVDFSDYIGSDLYNLIDILCVSGVIYGISIFIKKKYNQFISLSDNDNDIM